jgi:hypothetical protein
VKKLVAAGVALPALFVGSFVVLAGGILANAGGAAQPSAAALADIPPAYLALYQQAGQTCPGVPWTVLAAQGKVESNFNPAATSPAGAQGIAQFMPGTWASWGVDGNRDGRADPHDPDDAIPAQAHYTCALLEQVQGIAGDPLALMLAAYNAGPGAVRRHRGIPPYAETNAYVRKVLAVAASYGDVNGNPTSSTAVALLAHPSLTLSAAARADLAAGIVDERLTSLLAWLLQRHTLTVGGFKTGHPKHVQGQGDTHAISNHYYGRAADISAIDGRPVSAGNPAAGAVVLELAHLAGSLAPGEVGSAWDLPNPGFFTNAAHRRHVHVGYYSATTGARGP